MKQLIYAHRGASGYAPENTMRAFKLAIEKGADGIELDVHLTRDKQLVVFHDPILDRTTNGTGFVKHFTLQDLKKLDAGDGEKIPTLEEVIDLVVLRNKRLIIEFKTDPLEDAVETVHVLADFLISQKLTDSIIYSYWIDAVKVIASLVPRTIKAGIVTYLGMSAENLIQMTSDTNSQVLSVDWVFLTKKLVDLCVKNQIILCSYVLNNKTSFDYAKNIGAEILITDYPGKFTL